MKPSLIIIGAGTAGLAAGCYARMNGFPTTIFEMPSCPRGLCTSWRRDGYLFDGSVAGLAGTAPGNPLYRLWQELGIIDGCPLYYGENFGHVCFPDGRKITVHADVDKLEAHLMKEFPSEGKTVRKLTQGIRSFLTLDPSLVTGKGLQAARQRLEFGVSAIAHLLAILRYSFITIRNLSARTSDPVLKKVTQNLVHFGGEDVPLLTVLLPLAYAHRKMTGIPVHGWLSFAQPMEKRFLTLGGEIEYRNRVQTLLIERVTVKGVCLNDGTEHKADLVLSAADGRFTRYTLRGLNPDPNDPKFQSTLISDQPMQVNLGLNLDASAETGPVTCILPATFSGGGKTHDKLTIHTRYYDADAAPRGKCSATILLDSSYAWWKEVALSAERYREEKRIAADNVVAALGQFRPGFKNAVEVTDVSTPLTRERYTGNYLGAIQACKPSSNIFGALLNGKVRYASKDLPGLYAAGQWVEPWGGITTAALSARKAIAALSKDRDMRFTTSIP